MSSTGKKSASGRKAGDGKKMMRTTYCAYCKKTTEQKITGEGSGNTILECIECGSANLLIQGFNAALM